MKKFLIALLLIFPITAFAQLKLQVGGFVFEDTNEPYKVYQFDGVSASELFDRCKNTLLGMTANLDNISSENDSQMIVVTFYSNNDMYYKYMGQTVWTEAKYTIRLRFKDGRARIDAPTFQKITSGAVPLSFDAGGRMKNGQGLMFKKDGEPRLEKLKESMENYFNDVYTIIINGIAGKVDNDW